MIFEEIQEEAVCRFNERRFLLAAGIPPLER